MQFIILMCCVVSIIISVLCLTVSMKNKNTDEYKRVYEIASRYPDICLTIVANALTFTLYDNRKIVSILDFYKAIKNTKNIYEDVKIKEIVNFKETFKELFEMEGIDINTLD